MHGKNVLKKSFIFMLLTISVTYFLSLIIEILETLHAFYWKHFLLLCYFYSVFIILLVIVGNFCRN